MEKKVMTYQEMKKELSEMRRRPYHVTKKEWQTILEAREIGLWEKVFQTNLYIKYGGEYCTILQILG